MLVKWITNPWWCQTWNKGYEALKIIIIIIIIIIISNLFNQTHSYIVRALTLQPPNCYILPSNQQKQALSQLLFLKNFAT